MWDWLPLSARRVAAGIWLTVVVAIAPMAGAADLIVSGARIGVHPEATRFVLESSGQFAYRVFTLAEPYRVVIDLPEVDWRVSAEDGNTVVPIKSVVSNFRYGLFQPGNSRVVIDLAVPAEVKRHFILPSEDGGPYRFVLDLAEISATDFDPRKTDIRTPGWRETRALVLRPAALAPRPAARPKAKRVVVIDPGHGGVDPGSMGVTGAYEKKITLATAKLFKQALEKSGRYAVVLTRERDVFLRLRDRFEVAHRANASLFLSLHADSSPKRSVRGASIYTLSNRASDKEAEALAAKENKADIIAGADLSDYPPEVSSILIDLAQSDTNEESWHFAEMLVGEMDGRINTLRNTHRFAGFAVLKSPNVPSLLIELGYLSNRSDEKLLRNKSYMENFARAVLRATDRYFVRLKSLGRS
jgi:N-acetylmuramoyl-L-alanine amidase